MGAPEDGTEAFGWTGADDLDGLPGTPVVDPAGTQVGTVSDVYVDSARTPRYVAVQGGALGGRSTLVPVQDAHLAGEGRDRRVRIPYTIGNVREAPAWERRDEVQTAYEEAVHRHYGRPGWWEIVEARQTTPAPTPEIARADVREHQLEADIAGDVETLQATPAPTPEIAAAEVEDAIARGRPPEAVRVRRWRP